MALLMAFNLWIGPGFIFGNSWWISHLMKDLEGSGAYRLMFSCNKG
jgi:hypothetical protein